jgi:hypothetical protein
MHGQGKFSFASGACYEGCWEHNKYQGQGSYTFPDGKAYKVSAAAATAVVLLDFMRLGLK